jgi:hypothetical protein
MEGLKLARVVVLDDSEEEGLQIIKALWHNQIPAIYFSGPDTAPPTNERLVGVRLVFLDMDLVPGTTDPKSKMSALVGTLRRILAPNNGPYSVVAWTRHLELVKEFETYIFNIKDIPQPIAIAVVAKDDCKEDGGNNWDLQKVKNELNAKLAEISPLLFLQAWEGSCFNAAASVTATLSDLADQGGGTPDVFRAGWKAQMLRVLNSLAVAEGGRRHLKDGDTAVVSFSSALNPLHTDRLEGQSEDLCNKVRHCSKEIISKEAFEHIGPTAVGKINSMLHCSYERLDKFYAGNVYLVSTNTGLTPLSANLNDFFNGYLDAPPASPEQKYGFEFLKNNSIPVLLESNPTCDHAQKKVKVARLIAGLLIPRSEVEKEFPPRISKEKPSTWEDRMIAMIRTTAEWWHRVAGKELAEARRSEYRFVKRAESLWTFGPLYLNIEERPIKEYYLLLNALFVYSAKVSDVEKAKALFRLRTQAFSYMHFWFGNHASRPGMLMVESSS